jgi:ketosteroid isomerase-like protein
MPHPNEQVLRNSYDAFEKGDMDTLRGMFRPDAVGHITGRSPVAGDYKGVDAIFGFFQQIFERSGGTFRLEVHTVLADDEHGTVLTHVSGQREGRTLDANNIEVFHLRDGKIAEFWSLTTDPYGQDDFWS